MSVADKEIIDAVAYENDTLILEIYDHLDFEGKFEYDHMMILQEKLNMYIWFIESKQYEETYPRKDFVDYSIRIHFLCQMTELCKKYIENANKKLSSANIHIEYFEELEKT